MKSRFQKSILALFFLAGLFYAGSVLALELTYPQVPGLGALKEGQPMGFYFRYLLNLFFYLTAGACFIMLITAGVIYLARQDKPSSLIKAQDYVKRGIMGLSIVLMAYLLLYIINPQLLILNLNLGQVVFNPAGSGSQVVEPQRIAVVASMTSVDNTLKALIQTATTTKGTTVMAVELPFTEINELLTDALNINKELKAEFAKCFCGESKYYVKYEQNGLTWTGKCMPGMSDTDKKDKGFLKKIGAAVFDKIAGGQQSCQTQCDDCGTSPREANPTKICNITKMTELRKQLQEIVAKLEAQKMKFGPADLKLLAQSLTKTASQYLLANLGGGMFGAEYADYKSQILSQGLLVEEKAVANLPLPGQIPIGKAGITQKAPGNSLLGKETRIQNKLLADLILPLVPKAPSLPNVTDPSAFYASYPDNQAVIYESYRTSLMSVLMGMSLEKIDAMFMDCIKKAFGEGDYQLAGGKIEEMLQKSLQSGVVDAMLPELAKKSPEFAGLAEQGLKEGISDSVKSGIDKKITECKAKNCSGKLGNELVKCNENCSGNLPPDYLSQKLTDLLVKQDVKKALPDSIEKMLSQNLKQILFDKPTQEYVDSDLIKILPDVLKNALTKTLNEQVPWINDQLNKKLSELLSGVKYGDFLVGLLQSVDAFLTGNLNNFERRVKEGTVKMTQELVAELGKPVQDQIDNLQNKASALFDETGTPIDQCYERFRDGQGYHFKKKNGVPSQYDSCQFHGDCLKLTPEDINTLDVIYTGCDESTSKFTSITEINIDTLEKNCHGIGACWDDAEIKCSECLLGDLKGLVPTKSNMVRAGKEFLGGLLNFVGKFFTAILETTTYTSVRYSQVWVEDVFLIPFKPYLDQATDWQKQLHKFLNASVKDILPKALARTLQGNIDDIFKRICVGEDITGFAKKSGQKYYINELEVSDNARNKICEISRHLHTSLMKELENCSKLGGDAKFVKGASKLCDSIYDGLTTQVEKILPDDAQAILNQKLANILWPGVANITDLINLKPEDLICGKNIAYDQAKQSFIFTVDNAKSVKNQCNSLKYNQFGVVPYFRKATNLHESQLIQAIAPYCVFIWTACENPFANLNNLTWGKLISQIVNQSCALADKKVQPDCNSCSVCPEAKLKEISDLDIQSGCTLCNYLLRHKLGYLLIKGMLETQYGANIALGGEKKKSELNEYEWWLIVFPEISNVIAVIRQERGVSQADWNQALADVALRKAAKDLTQPKALQDITKSLASLIVQQKSIDYILTNPYLGITEKLHPEVKTYSGKNFLDATPYSFLTKDVCNKIKFDFNKANPGLIQGIQTELKQSPCSKPYSLECYQNTTINDYLSAIKKAEISDEGLKDAYLFCLALDYSPAQIFELDQNLVEYVASPYRVLFDLFNKELRSDERPQALNEFLGYMYKKTPPGVIGDIGLKLGGKNQPPTESGETLLQVEGFLNTQLGGSIQKIDFMNQRFIELIVCPAFQDINSKIDILACREFLSQTLLQAFNRDDWQIRRKELAVILDTTPIGLLDKYLNKPVQYNKNLTDSSDSLMKKIVANSVFGQKFIDIVGGALRLDEAMSGALDFTKEKSAIVDKAVMKAQTGIQLGFNDIILKHDLGSGMASLGRGLAALIGADIADSQAKDLTGECRNTKEVKNPVTGNTTLVPIEGIGDCKGGEVLKIIAGRNECCSMAKALVCDAKCRDKVDSKEKCDAGIGEVEDGGKCCFKNCQACRPARLAEKEEKLCHTEFRDKKDVFTKQDDNLGCCYPRDAENKITGEGSQQVCCVTLLECINGKVVEALSTFIDDFANGELPINPEDISQVNG